MIVLTNVHKTFDGGTRYSVNDVTLHVQRGQMLVLLGGSGCGKTTTLKMINRLIDPTSGTVVVDGKDVSKSDPVELRRRIGYVIQGSGLFPHMTVAENIAVVPKLLRWPKEKIQPRVAELLDMVRLPADQYADRLPRQLSGGQQQRVGFARALAVGPEVMLLDEPFGALDPVTRDELRGDFLALRKRLGLTAVMVTHDMMEALLSADLIAVMNAGELLQVGTPRQLITEPKPGFVAALMSGLNNQTQQLRDLVANTHGGYGENVRLVPVEGAVTMADKSLENGRIAFHPDKAKGNDRTFAQPPVGTVTNGKYTIVTEGNTGAPAGWYKVTVNASVPSDSEAEYSEPKLHVAKFYTEPDTTTLSVEVKEGAAAGSYDLKL